jgi:dTDP-4-dehydrorhamnose reductase
MKLLVLGAGGMAGHVIAIRLAALGHDVTGFARGELSFCETIVGDVMTADLFEIVRKYDAVINCIGVLNKAVDNEPHRGIWLNSYLPHLLAVHSKRVIHISTDCVFSGCDGGGYNEDSFRSADDYYGRTKALGELNDGENLTFRTSIIGPDINKNGIGLFNWFMKQTRELSGFRKAIWTGVTTITLADAVEAALRQELTGLYHLVNNEIINKYELLNMFNTLRTKPVSIKTDYNHAADKSLVNNRKDFNFLIPSYENMIENMGRWIAGNRGLYPHYAVRG